MDYVHANTVMIICCILVVSCVYHYTTIKRTPNRRDMTNSSKGLSCSLPLSSLLPLPATVHLHLNDHVDCIYIITLPARQQHVKHFTDTHAVQATIVESLTVNNIDINWLHKIADHSTMVSVPRVLCHASHIATLELFLASPHQTCLVFEDDVMAHITPTEGVSRYQRRLQTVLTTLPVDYDVVYLGYCWDICKKRTHVSEHVVRPFIPKCRHAYMVTRRGAEKIIAISTPLRTLPGDTIVGMAVRNKLLVAYAARQPLFVQNRHQLGSTLGNHDALKFCS